VDVPTPITEVVIQDSYPVWSRRTTTYDFEIDRDHPDALAQL